VRIVAKAGGSSHGSPASGSHAPGRRITAARQWAFGKTAKTAAVSAARAENGLDAINAAARSMQSDAPACNTCGHITIRSGTCYKCLNCGNSMGCS
jgi:ribonucleoside-diphosphate reductase alpha chain